ncbi:anti-sigma factor [Kitasatospora sp. NPDC096140]|uniref:anti-sigma factor n=1 Tax=Kitasatospora sp. NPDC096140 TaxID=3155425 RepID=UPI0033211044
MGRARTFSSRRPRAGAICKAVAWSSAWFRAGFLVSGMPPLPEGTAYELWFDDSGTMRPAGLMPATSGALLLSGPVNGARGVGVTVEPAGGSAHPTRTPLVVLPFSGSCPRATGTYTPTHTRPRHPRRTSDHFPGTGG